MDGGKTPTKARGTGKKKILPLYIRFYCGFPYIPYEIVEKRYGHDSNHQITTPFAQFLSKRQGSTGNYPLPIFLSIDGNCNFVKRHLNLNEDVHVLLWLYFFLHTIFNSFSISNNSTSSTYSLLLQINVTVLQFL